MASGERRPLGRLGEALGLTARQVAHERRHGRLGLAEEEVIALG
jgi:hypothetical protein